MSENSGLHEWLSYIDSLHSQVIDMSLDRIRAAAKTLDILKPAPFIFLVGGPMAKARPAIHLKKYCNSPGIKLVFLVPLT